MDSMSDGCYTVLLAFSFFSKEIMNLYSRPSAGGSLISMRMDIPSLVRAIISFLNK